MTSSVDKDLLCFGHLSCFNSLTGDELSFIQKSTRSLFFKKGETICKQGSFAPYVIFLSDGLAKIYIEVTRDKQISTHLAKSGDFISFSSIFNHDEYNTSAAALVDSDVCMIEKDAIISLLKSNSEFAYRIISRNWQIGNRLFNIINNLSFKQMAGKLASTLIYLDDFGYDNLFENLSRKEIAEFANISIESTVKLLKDFSGDGIITLDGKSILINKRKVLEDIARKG